MFIFFFSIVVYRTSEKMEYASSVASLTNDSTFLERKKDFQCNSCRERYSHSSSLFRHKRIKHKSNIHQCTRCYKVFDRADSLIRHYRKQVPCKSENDIWKCNICQKEFQFKSYLIRHQKCCTSKCWNCQDVLTENHVCKIMKIKIRSRKSETKQSSVDTKKHNDITMALTNHINLALSDIYELMLFDEF